MNLPRRYLRGGGLVLVLCAVCVVFSGNRGAFPVGKAAWMAWFGEPGPAVDRDFALAPMARNLTLHVVAHSHSDVGWNLSFHGYYRRSVRTVLRRVVAELWADARRRFTWGDLAFLDMWLDDEGDAAHGGMLDRGAAAEAGLTWRQAVQTLVSEGRLAVVGGTYVSPDEGLTTWWAHNAIVDVGHRVLAAQLNATPSSVGWQIDNFGHASTTPYLLANTGYSAMVLGRMAFRQQRALADKAALQFLWQRDSLTPALLTHFLSVHYAAPSARFDFDRTKECDPPALLAALQRFGRTQARQYPAHGHVLAMMGDDFRFVQARRGFECIDRLVGSVDAGVRVRYSTPREYFEAIGPLLGQPSLHVHAGDFYPYQDKPYEQYWSGVLATRAHLKWLVRDTEQIVQHAEALVAAMRIREHVSSSSSSSSSSPTAADWAPIERRLEDCRKQVAIGYHHDAVTGTCSAAAAADYKNRLRRAARQALRVGRAALGAGEDGGAYNTAAQFGAGEDAGRPEREYLALSAAEGAVAVTNAAALVPQSCVVRVRLASPRAAIVDAATGRAVPADAIGSVDGLPIVEFLAHQVPALGLRAYRVQPGAALVPSVTTSTSSLPRLAKSTTRVDLRVVGGRVRIAVGQAVVWHSLRQYPANPLVQSSGAYVMHSFMLMYLAVFAVFGVALVAGLAAAALVHRSSPAACLRWAQVPSLQSSSILLPPVAGTACGVAFTYYVAQVADAAMLAAWTVGRAMVGLRLALPAFLTAYVVAGVLRWPMRRCVLCIYGVAAGVVLALFYAPTWQSRPILPPSDALFDVRLGTVCDSASIAIGSARVTYRLCVDRPKLLQVTTTVAADRDREVMAHYELSDGASRRSLWPKECAFDIFNGVDVVRRTYSRWTPVPGNYYPAISHVALADRPLTLHLRHSTGATCIKKDTLEVMLHRHMSANDYRGLIDPISDPAPVAATHFIDLSRETALDTNHLVNAPLLAFALPNAANATALVNATTALTLAPIRNARLVGIQVADPGVRAVDDSPAVFSVLARVQALPGFHALDLLPADLLRPATNAFAVDGGDWTMAPLSERPRTERRVDRLRVSPGQQTLFRIEISKN
ncbi:Alpha-mannosidase 2 [Coemansia sp. BCRC 34301]|nr:Alpha-mannosidase 2 [Coemansia sp. BCRC 34301]